MLLKDSSILFQQGALQTHPCNENRDGFAVCVLTYPIGILQTMGKSPKYVSNQNLVANVVKASAV